MSNLPDLTTSNKSGFDALQERIEVTLTDQALLRRAFIHRSYINETKDTSLEHNERLEFLGDAVVSRHAFWTPFYRDEASGVKLRGGFCSYVHTTPVR